jgi:hypothetical protein
MENRSHAGCAWIVDQLIGIRDREQQLATALASSDEQASLLLDFRVAELNLSLEILERALDVYGDTGVYWDPYGETRGDAHAAAVTEDLHGRDLTERDLPESFPALAHG